MVPRQEFKYEICIPWISRDLSKVCYIVTCLGPWLLPPQPSWRRPLGGSAPCRSCSRPRRGSPSHCSCHPRTSCSPRQPERLDFLGLWIIFSVTFIVQGPAKKFFLGCVFSHQTEREIRRPRKILFAEPCRSWFILIYATLRTSIGLPADSEANKDLDEDPEAVDGIVPRSCWNGSSTIDWPAQIWMKRQLYQLEFYNSADELLYLDIN